MSASSKRKDANITQEEELLRNGTTTTFKQLPNKFISKVSGKPLPAVKTHIAKISFDKSRTSKKNSTEDSDTNILAHQQNTQTKSIELNNMESTRSLQLQDFSKKKQERDQEIKEIQEMLNKIKSPVKRDEQKSPKEKTSEESPKGEHTEVTANNCEVEEKEDSKKEEEKVPFYGRSKTELQLRPAENTNFRLTRKYTSRSCSAAAVTDKPRSSSSHLPLTAKEKQTNKKSSYNPEEARHYMEMQKKQRKLGLLKNPVTKSKIEKEEIKKRLEELKKNSRILVSKNLQKKEKFMGKTLASKDPQNKPQEQKDVPEPVRATNELPVELHIVKSQAKGSSSTSRTDTNRKESTMPEISHRSSQSLNNILKPAAAIPLLENHKRIGLLRKTENDIDFSLTSHRNYNFDKENQNLEILRKKLISNQENKINKDKNNTQCKEKEEQKTENFKKDKETQSSLSDGIEAKKSSNIELEANNLKLNKKEENKEKDTKTQQIEAPKPNELPYWLRPSSAQVYPYNFIMAVRRKLEAIADPIITNQQKDVNQQSQDISTTSLISHIKQNKRKPLQEEEEKYVKKFRRKQEQADIEKNTTERTLLGASASKQSTYKKKQTPSQILQIGSEHESEEKVELLKESEKNPKIVLEDEPKSMTQLIYLQKHQHDLKHICKAKSYDQISNIPANKPCRKSLPELLSDKEDFIQNSQHLKQPTNYKSLESLNSEINSNLSSISLQIPISNTLTEVSSLRTESRRTYTHSRKQLPTQSEDDMSSLSSHVFSSPEKKLSDVQRDFDFIKPRPVSPLSLEKVENLQVKRKESNETESEDKEMDFTQLLEDFNRSLSQVIEVNEQLKSTLDKSQQILSPHSSKKSSITDKHYSSDFEKSATSKEHDNRLKESLEKNNENLKQRKRQLFEMAEKVKPLLTPPKSAKVKEPRGKETPLLTDLNLNLDLKLLQNSASATERKQHTTGQLEIESEEQSASSKATQDFGERLWEIEKLRKSLKQTISLSREKHHVKEQQEEKSTKETKQIDFETELLKGTKQNQTEKILLNENKGQAGTNTGNSSPETYCEENESKHSSNKYRDNKIFKELTSESQPKSSDELQNNVDTHSLCQSNKMFQFENKTHNVRPKNYFGKNCQEITDYSSNFNSNSNSNNVSSHRHDVESFSNKIIENNKNTHNEKKLNDSETESYSGTQSEADSTTHTKETTKSKSSISKTNKSDPATSSSIAEELQKTYQSGSYENENMPSSLKKIMNEKKNSHEYADPAKFIKSHVNSSRGDFLDNISKAAEFNETKFQQAIEMAATTAASQISSSDFAQSADDEITSSVASKLHRKTVSNHPINNNNVISSGDMISKEFFSTTSPSKTDRRISMGSEIVKFFSRYDVESAEKYTAINDSMSESSFNYSNVGLYEKLIQNETNKSQHLAALLKMREKALMDRTKGQIAWLEVQKAHYKAKGLINHIAAIKKKQRGILLKMEKEREEIKRLLYTTTTTHTKAAEVPTLQAEGDKSNSQHSSCTKYKKEKLLSTITPPPRPLIKPKIENTLCTSPILRATYELESSRVVEELLKKRENDLKKRREHVERLMKWHQRLDEEEAELLNLERQLLGYSNVPHVAQQQQSKLPNATVTVTASATTKKLTTATAALSTTIGQEQVNESTVRTPEKKRASRARKMEKRLKEIDKSLRELSHISASSTTSVVMGQTNNEKEDTVSSVATQEVDFVRTTGLKLNKLWRRLTSQQIEKFEPTRRYKLCKSDLERLYEEAKMAVLRDFAEDEERIAKELLEKSASNLSSTASPTGQAADLPSYTTNENKIVQVPMLNLNFSSGHSEAEEESANNSQANVTQQGNYSPSVAEQNFKAQVLLNSSASSETLTEQQTAEEEQPTSRMESNVQMFLALSQRIQASGRQLHTLAGGLQRSLSDTEISDVQKFKAAKTTTSQSNIAIITSHSNSNSSIINNSPARSFDASEQHQRSKSSTVEITYIPSTQSETQTNRTDFSHHTLADSSDNHQESKQNDTRKDEDQSLDKVNHQTNSRSSVICSVGAVTPIKSSQPTSSDIATLTEDSKSLSLKQRLTYAGQIGTDSETKAKEISSKLDEISAAVTQLSQMNALPSYESVTHLHAKHKSIDEAIENNINNDESNLSTDASSYSFNFDNITTDKHSSPGTSAAPNNTNSLPHEIMASKTFTKEYNRDDGISHSPASNCHSLNSTRSKTFTKDDMKNSSQALTQSKLENRILDTYEADFESDLSNFTHIEDITIPIFETTAETSKDEDDTESSSMSILNPTDNVKFKVSDKTYNAEELKDSSSLLSLSGSDKSLSTTDLKSHIYSSDREPLLPPPPSPPPPPPPPLPSSAATAAAVISPINSATTSNRTGSNHLMPDIINELELRRHQLILDNEHLKQYEHVTAVPYMYVREIPNKPPPPYVPPAHGSPMTTIFPSEDRIRDITFRRTHELYCELLKTEYCNTNGEKLPSVMEEQITNIYERIVLDICRENLQEHGEILRDGDPTNFHGQLAFFNPPNRLRCIQDAIYKEVRTCLAMDKIQPKRAQIYSVYGQRAKQDHIGKIIIQEMYDEDDRWRNFHREESEVLHLMIEEMVSKNIQNIAKEVLLEEGGTIDEDEQIVEEENAANQQAEETSQFEECIDGEKSQQLQTSSVLVETISEEDQTYYINESKEDCFSINANANDTI